MMQVPLMLLSEWHEFSLAPDLAVGNKKLDGSSCPDVEITRVA
jgi:hypothetical protein